MKSRRLAFPVLLFAAILWISSACFGPYELPTGNGSFGIDRMGFGVERDATLHGSPHDPHVVWATDRTSGVRFELVWPWGYRAIFDPQLELFDGVGRVVAHEGDLLIGSCPNYGGSGPDSVDANDVRPPTWQPGDG